jgi:Rrf2 family protein
MKTDYALRILCDLAARPAETLCSARELAEHNNVPYKFLERIMADLRARGWLKSTAGKYGGYTLTPAGRRLTLGEALRGLDSLPEPFQIGHRDCDNATTRRFHRLIKEINDDATRRLATRQPMRKRSAETLAQYLMDGAGI